MCFNTDTMYSWVVPKLWTDTIEEHRRAVHDAALDAAATLIAEHGLTSVTMSKIAAATGIGRATLYKYFPDAEALLAAWHQRQITRHLAQLAGARDTAAGPGQQLEAVLEAYALTQRQHQGQQGTELAALLHKGDHVTRAEHELHAFLTSLLAQAAEAGDIRDDVPPAELASYCLHALAAASSLPSEAAARRLVSITQAGLRPATAHPGDNAGPAAAP
jgi:AcrR family transcriptional regulator